MATSSSEEPADPGRRPSCGTPSRAPPSTYANLVADRIAMPLGLDVFYVPAATTGLRDGSIIGTSRSGRRQRPWTGEALGPAGGIRATIGSMAGLAAALLDGSAPGIAALDPVANFAGKALRIGAAWVVLDRKGRTITWHNGGTGGFRTWLGLDRTARTGAVWGKLGDSTQMSYRSRSITFAHAATKSATNLSFASSDA